MSKHVGHMSVVSALLLATVFGQLSLTANAGAFRAQAWWGDWFPLFSQSTSSEAVPLQTTSTDFVEWGSSSSSDYAVSSVQSGYCGDGVTNGELGEQCDDYNTNDGDGCTSSCQSEYCGDGICNNGEHTWSCTSDCPAVCGNWTMEGTETCDDGNVNDNDGCSAACATESCGDGILQNGETCDDANADSTDGCAECQVVNGDGSGTNNCDDPHYKPATNDLCGPNVTLEGAHFACTKSDGTQRTWTCCNKEWKEVSDCPGGYGPSSSSSSSSSGTSSEYGSSHSSATPVCGNAIVEEGEDCDDGMHCDDDPTTNDSCTKDSDCGRFFGHCSPSSGDGCTDDCRQEFCGDGVTQPLLGEQCDLGGYCGTTAIACTSPHDCPNNLDCFSVWIADCADCKLNVCGDGERNLLTEECDDGKHCLDGSVCSDEADCVAENPLDSSCIPRSGDTCSSTCQQEFCGDGTVTNAGRCSDGRYCTGLETCRDGSPCPVQEECDAGGMNTVACDKDCTYAKCGDTYINPVSGEECDDGSHCANGSACTSNEDCADGSSCRPRDGGLCLNGQWCNGTTPCTDFPSCDTSVFGSERCNAVCQANSPKKCCTCFYEDHPECAERDQATCEQYDCKDGVDNDGDGFIDGEDPHCDNTVFGDPDASESVPGVQRNECNWTVTGCKNRFEIHCANSFAANACEFTRTFPGRLKNVPYPPEEVCTSTHDFFEGHSGPDWCAAYFSTVTLCVECNTAACQKYTNNGCSTMANAAKARSNAEELVSLLSLHGISSVVVEGHQMLSSPSCESITTFSVRETGVTQTYGPCNFGGYCYEDGETFQCTDKDGSTKTGMCCTNSVGYPSFIRLEAIGDPPACPAYSPCNFGDSCYEEGKTFQCTDKDGSTKTGMCCTKSVEYPSFILLEAVGDPPACPDTSYRKGECGGFATASTCNAATVPAWEMANADCKFQAEFLCTDLHPEAKFSRQCTGHMTSGSWVPPSCTWEIFCEWTCDW